MAHVIYSAYIAMAYIVMAYTVMAYEVMAIPPWLNAYLYSYGL